MMSTAVLRSVRDLTVAVLRIARVALIAALAIPALAQTNTHEILPCPPPEAPGSCGGGGAGGQGGQPITWPVDTFIQSLDQEPYRNADTGAFDVVLSSGEFTYDATDLKIPGRGFDFKLVRTYRSRTKIGTVLGRGWNFNYNERMYYHSNGDFFEWIKGTSWSDVFENNPIGPGYVSHFGFYGFLRKEADGSSKLRTPEGVIRHFAAGDGHLLSITDRNGNRMDFSYTADDKLDYVIDTMGRRIEFTYDAATGLLASVEDHGGRRVEYGYTNPYGNEYHLTSVTRPGVILAEGSPPQALTTTYGYSGAVSGELADNLTSVTDRNGNTVTVLTYGTNSNAFDFDRVITQQRGEVGQDLHYSYEEITNDPVETKKTIVTYRTGGASEHYYGGNVLVRRVSVNGPANDPNAPRYTTTYEYGPTSGRLFAIKHPLGSETLYDYDGGGGRAADGTLVEGTQDIYRGGTIVKLGRLPGPRLDGGPDDGSPQDGRATQYIFEPLFNQPRAQIDAAGNQWSVNFDYEEIGCSSAERTALLSYASYWNIDLSGSNDPPCDLGDLNDDGVTTGIAGNSVRGTAPAYTDADGAAQPGSVVKRQYNSFGQIIIEIDPGGFIAAFEHYPEERPFDGIESTAPPPNRTLDATTGGYLKTTITDAENAALGRPSGAVPAPVEVQTDSVYDRWGNLIKAIDPRGVVTQQTLNALNAPLRREVAVSVEPVPRGEAGLAGTPLVTIMTYDPNLNLVEMRETASSTTGVFLGGAYSEILKTFTYDALNNPIQTDVQWGLNPSDVHTTHLAYDDSERPIRAVSPEGRVTRTDYDYLGRVIEKHGFANTLPLPILDASLDPVADDAHDSVTTYEYDEHGNATVVRSKNILKLGEPEVWLERAYTFDGFDEPVQTQDPGCTMTEVEYDARGSKLTTSLYGSIGGPPEQAPSCPSQPRPPLALKFGQYDERGRAHIATSEDFQHDEANPLLTIPNPDGSQASVRTFWDARGLVTRILDPKGRPIETTYDGAGRVVEVRSPQVDDPANPGSLIDTEVVSTEYNQAGLPVRVVTTETGSGGTVSVYEETASYDAMGRLLARTVGTGSEALTTVYEFDARGNVTRAISPTGSETTNLYDAYDRVVSAETTVEVDVDFNPDGKVVTSYSYDGDGLLVSRSDDRGEQTVTTYDGRQRPVEVDLPDGVKRCLEYSPAGNVLRVSIVPPGQTCAQAASAPLRYYAEYDAMSRTTSSWSVNSDPSVTKIAGTPTQTREYDGLGRVTHASDDNSGLRGGILDDGVAETVRVHDSQGRIVHDKQIYLNQTATIQSTYLIDGFRSSLSHATLGGNAWIEHFTPDAMGRVSQILIDDPVNQIGDVSVHYRYQGGGRVVERDVVTSTTIRRSSSFDALGRLVGMQYEDFAVPANPGLVAGFLRGYDTFGRPSHEEFTHRPAGNGHVGRAFTTDMMGRLTSASEGEVVGEAVPVPTSVWDYRLDGLGNWGEYASNQSGRRTQIGSLNFYDQVDREFDGTTWDDGRSLSKDILGNTHREERQGYDIVYHYDSLSRLVRVETDDGTTLTLVAEFGYDAFNRRIETDVDGPSGDRRIWVYDGWRILDELGYATQIGHDSDGIGPSQVIARNFYGLGLDELLVSDRDVDRFVSNNGLADGVAEQRLLPVTDFRGSTERILGSGGQWLERYEYTPYGETSIVGPGGSILNSGYDFGFGYGGYRREPFLNGVKSLHFARNRIYDAAAGRFVQRDPIGLAGGPNVYAYASSQPISLVDPLGLLARPDGPPPGGWAEGEIQAAARGCTGQCSMASHFGMGEQIEQRRRNEKKMMEVQMMLGDSAVVVDATHDPYGFGLSVSSHAAGMPKDPNEGDDTAEDSGTDDGETNEDEDSGSNGEIVEVTSFEEVDLGECPCPVRLNGKFYLISASFKVTLHVSFDPSVTLLDKLGRFLVFDYKNPSAFEIATAFPLFKLAKWGKLAARGGAAAVRVGQAGEAAVRAVRKIGKPTRIEVNGAIRIPDGLTGEVLSEVKNVASLSYTRQLRDFAQFAAANGMRFDLYVRPGTRLSGPLLEADAAGLVNIIDDIPLPY